MWQYFLCARLLPINHYSTVDRKRAISLYAIIRTMRFDVGRIIYNWILHASRVMRVGYFFPSLVTALCAQAGVVFGPDEVQVQPAPCLTQIYMYKLTSGDKGMIDHRRHRGQSSSSQQTKKNQRHLMEAQVAELQEWKTWATDQLTYQSKMLQGLYEMQRLQLEHAGIDDTHIKMPQDPGAYVSREDDTTVDDAEMDE